MQTGSLALSSPEAIIGSVTNPVRHWLRLEGVALLVGATLLYAKSGRPWWLYLVLFLAPDLATAGYLSGKRLGAFCYNATHACLGPIVLGIAGVLIDHPPSIALGLIWTAHVGIDRLLGFGLKYPTGDRDTHLGRIVFPWEAGK